MLATLRNNTWIVKFIVGGIAIMMIIFFGSETIRKGGGLDGTKFSPAKVNGAKISPQRVAFLAGQQLENYRQFFKDGVPEQFSAGIRQNVINSLINRELLWQEASHLGLAATPEEVATFVSAQPQFQENGEFRSELFNDPDGYRMAFQQRNGLSYTAEITTQLTLEKLFNSFDDVVTPADAELAWLQTAKDTSFDFSVVRIDKKSAQPKPDAVPDTAKKPDVDPKATAELVYNMWQHGDNIDATLKDRGLEMRNTGPLSYSKLSNVFDGSDERAKIKQLATLTTDKPFPATYFESENFYYLVRLKSVKQPDPKALADQKADLTEQYNTHVSNKLQEALVRELRQHADIVIK